MNYNKRHPWKVDKKEAILIQEKLSKQIILNNSFNQIKSIAGCDVAYSSTPQKAYAAICLLSFPALKLINEITCISDVSFPYITGLFSFREGPALLKAFDLLKENPDIIIFNGQGIAHPRKMGLATHMGIILDRPSIGCTQKILYGNYYHPNTQKGSYSEISNKNNDILGVCLRTREKYQTCFYFPGI